MRLLLIAMVSVASGRFASDVGRCMLSKVTVERQQRAGATGFEKGHRSRVFGRSQPPYVTWLIIVSPQQYLHNGARGCRAIRRQRN
jgi:hypothetical protein